MRKIEKVILTLCYLFVLVSCIRMSVSLVQDLPEFSFISLLYLAVFFLAEFALLFVAGVLLFSKPKSNKPERF
jgi:hypothetical protein